ncbi:uncharacterized protein [Branchiostoma lanceolatum]|uniref:uncharacterized protein n=1 Tax=Branchiostoma lanceolatum TaxID=7740 RepID=UPI003456F5EC
MVVLSKPIFCNECGARAQQEDNFCDNCGERLRKRKVLETNVHCPEYIDHSDIAKFLYDNNDRLADTDRRLLQEALELITSQPKWVRKHATVAVYGQLVRATFCSGDRTNKFVVQLNSEDRPTHVVEERGWRLWFRDGFKTAWGWFKDVAGSLVGPLVKSAGSLVGPLANLAIGWSR